MSDQLSDNRQKQPWLRHFSDENQSTQPPSPLPRRSHYPDHSANLRFGMWGRGGAKAYFRFHGGIGDGRGGVGCRSTEKNTAARPLQLFEALNPAHFQIDMLKKACEGGLSNPATGKWVPPTETNAGTGVFLPVYQKRIGFNKVDDWKTNADIKGMYGGGGCRRGQMKQDEEEKCFGVEEEGKEFDEIPIEMLLPPEWTY